MLHQEQQLCFFACYTHILGFPDSSAGEESTYNARDPSWIPGSGRSTGEGIGYPLQYSWASLLPQLIKICLQCGRPGFNPWVGKIPWRRKRLPSPVFWPGEFHGLYSPWGSQGVGHNWMTFTSHSCFPWKQVSRGVILWIYFLGVSWDSEFTNWKRTYSPTYWEDHFSIFFFMHYLKYIKKDEGT